MAAPPIATSEKPFVISQIRAYIPIILNLDKMNYDVWREIFETHCLTFGVLDHLGGSSVATPETEKTWKEQDGLVKMWIYGTITDSLVETILTPKSTAHDLWMALKNLFRDNKENRALQLENELRMITIGDTTVQEYCRKLKSLSDLLANVESPVTDRQLVMHCLNSLNDKFEGIHNVIRHRSPFPSFHTTRSMLLAEEERLSRQSKPSITHNDSSSKCIVCCRRLILQLINSAQQQQSWSQQQSQRWRSWQTWERTLQQQLFSSEPYVFPMELPTTTVVALPVLCWRTSNDVIYLSIPSGCNTFFYTTAEQHSWSIPAPNSATSSHCSKRCTYSCDANANSVSFGSRIQHYGPSKSI